ncbi:uncharacterized protein N7459_005182 [Penicillium hispanicum]|uniref:uncharacterized protein n=1 Tax=Penicillium hispanicum TaxID=1080232 RepID=UPI0025408A85|nr:uncharacterized protein N7459_005182 [Penicillium hispanicum]KAJ5585382.1 hypothetical protein N7459_005182 [Penicillium hispanicum]
MVPSTPLGWSTVFFLLVSGSYGYPQQRSSSSSVSRSTAPAPLPNHVVPTPTIASSVSLSSSTNDPSSASSSSAFFKSSAPAPSTDHVVPAPTTVPSTSSVPLGGAINPPVSASSSSSSSSAAPKSSGIVVAPGVSSQSDLPSSSSDSSSAPVANPATSSASVSSTSSGASSATGDGARVPTSSGSSGGSGKGGDDDDDDDDPTNGGTAFAPVSASMSAPSDPGASAVATNAGNPSQTANIVQGTLPKDQFSHVPAIGFGDVLPIKLTIDGKEKPAVVDFLRRISIPLGDDTDWLKPEDIPHPGLVGLENPDSCPLPSRSSSGASPTTASPTVISSTTSPSTTSASSSSNSSNAPSSTLDCHQNIATGGPSASQVAKALRNDHSFSSFCDDQASVDSLYQSMKHGMLEISATRGSPGDNLRYCKQGMKEIIDTCITGSSDYGGVYKQGTETYNITNTIDPYNPLEVDVDDGAPSSPFEVPTSTSTKSEPPMPTETKGNNDGSGLCKSLQGACKRAYKHFKDDYIYKDYTYISVSAGDDSPVNVLFWWAAATNGCKAEFKCDDYGEGMSGKQIKQSVENMFENDKVDECGTTYLSNSCQVKLNGCDTHCGTHVPCDSLAPNDNHERCY